MKFEIKIIIVFTLVMILILFYFNTVVISFLDHVKEDFIYQSYGKKTLDKRFVEEKFQDYLKNVFLWEVLLTLSMGLILYKLIYRITNREKEYRKFLEMILLTICHKLGNFLAIHTGNIEILKVKYDENAVKRLEKSYNYLKEDFQRIVDTINRFKNFSEEKEKLNIKSIIEHNLSLVEFKSKLTVRLNDVLVYSNKHVVDNIIFSLLDNAIKYSKEKISIRLTKNYLAIRNDLSDQVDKGSGVGLKITEALSKKEGFKIKYRIKREHFLVLLKFR